jgi:hypothetical protein
MLARWLVAEARYIVMQTLMQNGVACDLNPPGVAAAAKGMGWVQMMAGSTCQLIPALVAQMPCSSLLTATTLSGAAHVSCSLAGYNCIKCHNQAFPSTKRTSRLPAAQSCTRGMRGLGLCGSVWRGGWGWGAEYSQHRTHHIDRRSLLSTLLSTLASFFCLVSQALNSPNH